LATTVCTLYFSFIYFKCGEPEPSGITEKSAPIKTKENLFVLAIDLWRNLDHTIGSLATLEHFQGTAVCHFIACGFKNLKITGINFRN
jgi:hypothetical protein